MNRMIKGFLRGVLYVLLIFVVTAIVSVFWIWVSTNLGELSSFIAGVVFFLLVGGIMGAVLEYREIL